MRGKDRECRVQRGKRAWKNRHGEKAAPMGRYGGKSDSPSERFGGAIGVTRTVLDSSTGHG